MGCLSVSKLPSSLTCKTVDNYLFISRAGTIRIDSNRFEFVRKLKSYDSNRFKSILKSIRKSCTTKFQHSLHRYTHRKIPKVNPTCGLIRQLSVSIKCVKNCNCVPYVLSLGRRDLLVISIETSDFFNAAWGMV